MGCGWMGWGGVGGGWNKDGRRGRKIDDYIDKWKIRQR